MSSSALDYPVCQSAFHKSESFESFGGGGGPYSYEAPCRYSLIIVNNKLRGSLKL